MIRYIASIQSETEYIQHVPNTAIKSSRESLRDYNDRTWRECAHWDTDGMAFIPGTAFKWGLVNTAKFLFPKHEHSFLSIFRTGIIIPGKLRLPYSRDTVERLTFFA